MDFSEHDMSSKTVSPSESVGSTQGHSSSTFEFFPKLPTELRLKIWQHALDLESPCIVEVEHHAPMLDQSNSSRLLPAFLSTTHESRIEALRVYKTCFSVQPNIPGRVYFNFDKDTLYVGSRCATSLRDLLENCTEEERSKIKRLAFDPLWHWETFLANEEDHDVAAVLHRDLPGLEQLVLAKEGEYVEPVDGYDIIEDDIEVGHQLEEEEDYWRRWNIEWKVQWKEMRPKTPVELRNLHFYRPTSRIIDGEDLLFDANVAEEIMEMGKQDHPDWKLPRIRVLGIRRGKEDEDSGNWEDWEEQIDEYDPLDAWEDGVWEGEWDEYDTEDALAAAEHELYEENDEYED